MGGRRDFRWGDAAEEDDGIEGVLPPTQIIGPDEKGVKIIIEWRKNEEGVRTKVTKTVRVRKQVSPPVSVVFIFRVSLLFFSI
jgi:translation initiation factor 3 subunit G